MRLKRLILKNYYGFYNSEINFKNKITIFVGGNNSGKSHLYHLITNRINTMIAYCMNPHLGFSYEYLIYTNDCELFVEGRLNTKGVILIDDKGNKNHFPFTYLIYFDEKDISKILSYEYLKEGLFSKGGKYLENLEKEIKRLFKVYRIRENIHGIKFCQGGGFEYINAKGNRFIGGISKGKSVILSILMIVAIRRLEKIDSVLVIDDLFAFLDTKNKRLCLKILQENSSQLILFARENELKDMDLKADYKLNFKGRKTIVTSNNT